MNNIAFRHYIVIIYKYDTTVFVKLDALHYFKTNLNILIPAKTFKEKI